MAELWSTEIKGFAELDQLLARFPVEVQRKLGVACARAGAKIIADAARNTVPVKTSALRNTIRVSVTTRTGQIVAHVVAGKRSAGVYWMNFIEKGTKPHWILPKKAQSLRLASGTFASMVVHPGARAKPFMLPSLQKAAPWALKAMEDNLSMGITKEFLKSAS